MLPFFLYSGYIGTFLLCLSFVPQIHTVYKTKNVVSLSYGFIILQFSTCIFLGAYGLGFLLDNDHNGIPILIANIWIISCIILLTIAKIKYKIEPDNKEPPYVKSPNSKSKNKI